MCKRGGGGEVRARQERGRATCVENSFSQKRQHDDGPVVRSRLVDSNSHSPPFNQRAISRLGEQGFARYHTKPAKCWHYPQLSSLSSLCCILACIVPQVVTNPGPVT